MRTSASWITRLISLITFFFRYIYSLVLANARVAADVVTPTHYMKPGIVAVPLSIQSDLGILILSNLISMTPGSLTLDVSGDRTTIFIHAMYVDDLQDLKDDVKLLEHHIKEVLGES